MNKRIICTGLICAAVMLCTGCKDKKPTIYDEGIKEINSENYYSAIDKFTEVLSDKRTSKNKQLNSNLYMAEANMHLEQYDDAAACYEEALKLDSQNPKIHKMLGRMYLKQKNNEKAAEYFKNAIKYGDSSAAIDLGEIYINMADYESAEKQLLEYSSDNLLSARACYYLSRCCFEQNKPEVAKIYAKTGLRLNDSEYNTSLLFLSASIDEQLGEWESAYKNITEYLKLCPDDEEAKREYLFLSTRVK